MSLKQRIARAEQHAGAGDWGAGLRQYEALQERLQQKLTAFLEPHYGPKHDMDFDTYWHTSVPEETKIALRKAAKERLKRGLRTNHA